jgi:hypothetical protein
MSAPIPFNEFISSLTNLTRPSREDPAMQAQAAELVEQLRAMGPPTRAGLEAFVAAHPDSVPLLATCAGLAQEQLKNQLSHYLGSAGWTTLARSRPAELIGLLDGEFGLVAKLTEQLARNWSFADVLLERHLWSRRTAAHAVGQGRRVEDYVEEVARRMGITYQLRTRFTGRNVAAPCDLAIPEGGPKARVVVAMKGFNSTGSKLSDAVREVEAMAQARAPSQYVFAVVDGIGWRNRQADLRRIHALWDRREIDGLYTLAHLDRFEADLRAAADRLGLLKDAPALPKST